MKQRLLVAAIGVPLLILVLVFLPPVATGVLVCAIAAAAAYELLHTACKAPCVPVYVLTALMAALTVLVAGNGLCLYRESIQTARTVYLACAFLYVTALFFLAVRRYGTQRALPFGDLAVCIVAGFVFPAMYGCICLLRNISPIFVLMPFVIAFVGDSASMLGGMAFGKRKFAPRVSPNKTWAGFIAGAIGSALGMVILGLIVCWAFSAELPLWLLAVAGALANLFGQLGDLSMSLIKREAGIKDYSHIFLTHGGVLDRFDSTMFIAPVVYGLLMMAEAFL